MGVGGGVSQWIESLRGAQGVEVSGQLLRRLKKDRSGAFRV